MIEEDNRTIWCGNLAENVTEELLYELFLQAGPLERVKIPKDRDGRARNFGFITYCHEVSVPYALKLFRGTALFHRTLQLQVRGRLAVLPPPIRCNVSENIDFNDHAAQNHFLDMTSRMGEENHNPVYVPTQRNEDNDELVLASLQGYWPHRRSSYKSKEKNIKDNFKYRNDPYSKANHWKYKKYDNRPRRK